MSRLTGHQARAICRRMTDTPPSPDSITTLYNGGCPVCSMEINHYQRLCDRDGIALGWVDIARDEATLARLGLTREEAERRLHVIDGEGRLLAGVDAFQALWRRMPRYRWLATLVDQPVVRPVAILVYDRVLAPGLVLYNRIRRRRAGRDQA